MVQSGPLWGPPVITIIPRWGRILQESFKNPSGIFQESPIDRWIIWTSGDQSKGFFEFFFQIPYNPFSIRSTKIPGQGRLSHFIKPLKTPKRIAKNPPPIRSTEMQRWWRLSHSITANPHFHSIKRIPQESPRIPRVFNKDPIRQCRPFQSNNSKRPTIPKDVGASHKNPPPSVGQKCNCDD